MENSLGAIFDEIWSWTKGYSPWFLVKFLSNLKNSKFDQNQLKLETQHKYMYTHQKKL